MGTRYKPGKGSSGQRTTLPLAGVDGRRKAPRVWADALAGILGAMDGEITPPRRSLAHTAASLTVRLGEIDAAVAEGRPIAADHVRIAGQLNRTLRSLGIVEGAPLSSPARAMVGAGASSTRKKMPPFGSPEAIALHKEWRDELCRQSVSTPEDNQERAAQPDRAQDDDNRKSFMAHGDSPRRDE